MNENKLFVCGLKGSSGALQITSIELLFMQLGKLRQSAYTSSIFFVLATVHVQ